MDFYVYWGIDEKVRESFSLWWDFQLGEQLPEWPRLLRNDYDHNAPEETDHHFTEQQSVKFIQFKKKLIQ